MLLVFVALTVVINLPYVAIRMAFGPIAPGDTIPVSLRSFTFTADIFIVLATSALQAIVFSRLGQYIDRPYWKVESDKDALRRFFMPWLILNLIVLVTIRLEESILMADAAQDASSALSFLFLVEIPLMTPIAACIMFLGRFRWSTLHIALAPFVYHLPRMLLLTLCYFFMVSYLLATASLLKDKRFVPLIDALLAICQAYAFICAWLICMMHRDESDEEEF